MELVGLQFVVDQLLTAACTSELLRLVVEVAPAKPAPRTALHPKRMLTD